MGAAKCSPEIFFAVFSANSQFEFEMIYRHI